MVPGRVFGVSGLARLRSCPLGEEEGESGSLSPFLPRSEQAPLPSSSHLQARTGLCLLAVVHPMARIPCSLTLSSLKSLGFLTGSTLSTDSPELRKAGRRRRVPMQCWGMSLR